MQLAILSVILFLLTFSSQAAVFSQDKLSKKVAECPGHYIYFEIDNCINRVKLFPRVVSYDGLTKLEPTQAFPQSICVRQGAYHGHAYLFSDGIKDDGSNAQNVTFWFNGYEKNTTHTAALMQLADDQVGVTGVGPQLVSPAELTTGVFTSTPRNMQPLSYLYDARLVITGSGKDDALRLTFC